MSMSTIYGSPMLCVPALDWSAIAESVDISGVAECDLAMAVTAVLERPTGLADSEELDRVMDGVH